MSDIDRLTDLETRKIGDVLWVLTSPLIYKKGDEKIKVPIGFVTDGASCPEGLWSFCSPMSGPQAEAAVLHDWLYSLDSGFSMSRHTADDTFLAAMLANKTNEIKALLIYEAVRVEGKSSWKVQHSADKELYSSIGRSSGS